MPMRRLLHTLRADLHPGTERGALVRSAIGTIGLKVGAILLTIGSSLLYARVLGPHGYGLYAYVIAWTTVLAIPAGLGIPSYLVREGAKLAAGRLRALLHWSDKWIVMGGLVASAFMAAAVLVPPAADARWLFVIAAPIPLLANLGAVRSALLQSRGKVARSQWPMLLGPALMLAVLFILWLWRGRLAPVELVWVATLAALCQSLVNHWQLRRMAPSHIDRDPLPTRLREALPFMWLAGLYLLNSRTDLLMLGGMKGAYDVGIYAIASRAAELTSITMAAVNMVLAPKIAALYGSGQLEVMRRMVRSATRRVLLASIPLASLLFFGARPLLGYFYGERFEAGALPLQILVLSQVVVVGSGPLGTLLNMTGLTRVNSQNMMVAVALNVALNAVLIPRFGATGAATATAISLIFSRLLLSYQVRRQLEPRPPGWPAGDTRRTTRDDT
jgi:O-antigen/teichoic acid export membrane protein